MRQSLLLILSLLIPHLLSAQNAQPPMELTTMRIGAFRLAMSKAEATAQAQQPLQTATAQNQYQGETLVYDQQAPVKVTINQRYTGENQPDEEVITQIISSSPRFRTKSGMGVGSTRHELLDTYKDFANFEVYAGWDEEDYSRRSAKVSYFVLKDVDAVTALSFKMVQNVVVEVMVYMDDEGC